jgi:hypothetical protein
MIDHAMAAFGICFPGRHQLAEHRILDKKAGSGTARARPMGVSAWKSIFSNGKSPELIPNINRFSMRYQELYCKLED